MMGKKSKSKRKNQAQVVCAAASIPLRVYRPISGQRDVNAKPGAVMTKDETYPALVMPNDEVVIFDPRSVVVALDTNTVVYSPRISQPIPAWVSKWLEEHPEWPSVLELE